MFRRGFKTWCERSSLELRDKLGLKKSDPLNPLAVAKELGITVWYPKDVPKLSPESLDTLRMGAKSWSAVTLHLDHRHLIIVNSWHSNARQISDLAHEIAHIMLQHRPAQMAISDDGALLLNTYDQHLEDEAAWLAGCLLLPREALLHIKLRRLSNGKAREIYGVSDKMLTWRMNITGVNSQFRRVRRQVPK